MSEIEAQSFFCAGLEAWNALPSNLQKIKNLTLQKKS